MADDSAVVLVGPDDNVDSILAKVRDTGADTVQLLVSDGAPALQSLGGLARLQNIAIAERIRLQLIASDQKTLNAARLCNVEALEVTGARVLPPPDDARSYETRPLPAAARPADEDTLRALDDLGSAPPARRAPIDRADDDAFAGDLRPSAAPDPFDFDDYRDADDDEPLPPVPTRTRPRDERTDAATARRSPAGRITGPAAEPQRPPRYAEEEAAPRRRRVSPLLIAIPLLLIGVLLAGAFYLLRGQATVIVKLPVPPSGDTPFQDVLIPVGANPPADANSASVQAVPVGATVLFTTTGTVSRETTAPNNPARGTVSLLNYNAGAFNLPQGSEFIATKADGQEVRFVSDGPVTLPGATTASQGVNIVTSPGQAAVNITARAPGSASNVEGNTITQLALPGQASVALAGGTLRIEHGPITGGDEKTVRVVTDDDVQAALPAALTGLDDAAPGALQAAADAQGQALKVEPTTLAPGRDQLSIQGDGQVYELIVTPPAGTEIDPNSPNFSVTVRATFSALATPADRPLETQFQTAVPRQLAAAGQARRRHRAHGERLALGRQQAAGERRAQARHEPPAPRRPPDQRHPLGAARQIPRRRRGRPAGLRAAGRHQRLRTARCRPAAVADVPAGCAGGVNALRAKHRAKNSA